MAKRKTRKKKQAPMQGKALLVASIMIALVGVVGMASATPDLGARLLDRLVDKVSGDMVLDRLMGNQPEEEEMGLSIIESANTGLTNLRIAGELQLGSSTSTGKFLASQVDVVDWPAGSHYVALKNNRTTTSTVDRLRFDMTGTATQVASSTFYLNCGVGTSDTVAANATTPAQMIDDYAIVTTTQKVIDSFDDDIALLPSILVGPGEFFTCHVQSQLGGVPGQCDSAPESCENVTSTNRGWIADMITEWSWVE